MPEIFKEAVPPPVPALTLELLMLVLLTVVAAVTLPVLIDVAPPLSLELFEPLLAEVAISFLILALWLTVTLVVADWLSKAVLVEPDPLPLSVAEELLVLQQGLVTADELALLLTVVEAEVSPVWVLLLPLLPEEVLLPLEAAELVLLLIEASLLWETVVLFCATTAT